MNSNLEIINCDSARNENCSPVVVGDYSFSPTDLLGRGCEGSVFRGAKHSTEEPVAIKAIEHKRMSTTIQRVLLQNEKAVVRLLIQHPIKGVTEYKQIFETKTHTYLIMELYHGRDLEKVLKTEKIGQEQAKDYMGKILNGFIGLRSINVVHRDLKPANILVDQFANVQIADFGFAVVQEQESKKYTYCLGSPVYCSPQSLVKFEYGVKSDIWALGVIAFKLATGKTPWKGKSNKELIDNMKSIPIETLIEGIQDEKLKRLICGCCQVDMEKRFGLEEIKCMAAELSTDLPKGVQNQRPILSQTPQKTKLIKKPTSSKPERKKSFIYDAEKVNAV